MSIFEFFSQQDPQPMPKLLYSEYLDGPFTECSVCGQPFTEQKLYTIQKSRNERETIFEIAVCMECGSTTAQDYSRESVEAISAFIQERMRWSEADDRCCLCGREISEFKEFSLCGLCRGEDLIFPIKIMCHSCEEEMQGLLSEQTRRAHEEFIEKNVPGVPESLDYTPSLMF